MRTLASTLAVLLLMVAPLAAQSLDRVEELARLGRTEEARSMLEQWWQEARDAAPQRDLQRGLWLRGRLTADPNIAELDYQRLVVLYPSSPFAPQALLRLAQSAHANGDAAMASTHVQSIVRDYPTSPVRAEAEAWLRGAGAAPSPSDAPRPTPATTTATTPAIAPTPTPTPTTTANPTPSPSATPTPAPATQPQPPAPAEIPLEWSVQFGAFTDQNRAFALHEELVAAGLAARLVRVEGSGFVHVRIGRYSSRAEASTQLQQVTARGFTAAIVRDVRAEEVVYR